MMKNFEKNTVKNLKKNVYYWYLSKIGTHEEKLEELFKSLTNIVLPPMTDKLKSGIISYIESRNKIFEAQLLACLDVQGDIRKALS